MRDVLGILATAESDGDVAIDRSDQGVVQAPDGLDVTRGGGARNLVERRVIGQAAASGGAGHRLTVDEGRAKGRAERAVPHRGSWLGHVRSVRTVAPPSAGENTLR
jgi:hypothetical protein